MVENESDISGTSPIRPSKSGWITPILAPVAACALFFGACYLDCNDHGHSSVGREAHEALLDRDAKMLLSLVSPEEVRAGGLTEANLQAFIDNYVFRGYKQVTVAKVYASGPDFPTPTSHWYRDYQMDDGHIMNIGFLAEREGYVVNLIHGLLTARLWHEDPRSAESKQAKADVIERDIDILDGTGITGVYFADKFRTWKEHAAFLRDE